MMYELKPLKGMNEAKEFFLKMYKLFIRNLKQYYKSMPNEYKEHGFMNREQQVKSFLTPAISKLSRNSFLQECPIKRRKNKRARKKMKTGHVDYWVNYKNSSFVIEVKHNWIRFWKNNQDENNFTIYGRAIERMDSAIKQTKTIYRKRDLRYGKNLFAISLIVAPVYNFGQKYKFNTSIVKSFEKKLKIFPANIYGLWKIEDSYCKPNRYKENGKFITEHYPCLAFIGKIDKVSRS